MRAKLRELLDAGQSVWLDDLSRAMLESGSLQQRIDDGLRGVTSNPTIIGKAMAHGTDYDDAIEALAPSHRDAESLFWELAIADIKSACDRFRALYDACDGCDGFVSLEVSPAFAHDTAATVAMAHNLWQRIDRPNAMIKIPATTEGFPAIEQCTADGININVTLVFSVAMYEDAAQAYVRGLKRRIAEQRSVRTIASANSLFLSRIDTAVDDLPGAIAGEAALATARLSYVRYRAVFESPEFAELAKRGARPQRPLWASTGTKNPVYGDLKYVEPIVARNTISTMPPKTLDAFMDHGTVRADAAVEGIEESRRAVERMRQAGIDLDGIAGSLQREGIAKFCESYRALLDDLERKRRKASKTTP